MTAIEPNNVICGDSAQILKTFPDDFVDLTVTSPPYDGLRNYNGFSFDFMTIAKELFRVTRQGGVLVWIINDSVINGSESGTSFKQALLFKDIGFNLHDTMIYAKTGSSLPDNMRYSQNFEYMFVFSKGKPKSINLIKDKPNKTRGRSGFPIIREQSGELTTRKNRTRPAFGIRQNIWVMNQGLWLSTKDRIAYEHPAIFPEELARDHILSWSKEGDLVLDCFAGSGTTLKMARLHNRNYLGIEISPEYCNVIEKRLSKHDNQRLESFLTLRGNGN